MKVPEPDKGIVIRFAEEILGVRLEGWQVDGLASMLAVCDRYPPSHTRRGSERTDPGQPYWKTAPEGPGDRLAEAIGKAYIPGFMPNPLAMKPERAFTDWHEENVERSTGWPAPEPDLDLPPGPYFIKDNVVRRTGQPITMSLGAFLGKPLDENDKEPIRETIGGDRGSASLAPEPRTMTTEEAGVVIPNERPMDVKWGDPVVPTLANKAERVGFTDERTLAEKLDELVPYTEVSTDYPGRAGG